MKRKPKVLDLFCGAGGASAGLKKAGFEVQGVDLKYQPHYPYAFQQADALTVSLVGFDLIWASPPCQAFTKAQRIWNNKHPDYITSIRARFRAQSTPWVIENTVGAPLINPIELCGTMFDLPLYRHRLFECSFFIEAPPHPRHKAPLAKMGRPIRKGEFMHVVGNFSGVAQARVAMGIDWMPRDALREAIPPAYSEFIGRAILTAEG